ncbi:10335_t:CDS:2, partial [Racocetra persica]
MDADGQTLFFNNFEFVPEDYSEDTESVSLVAESESIIAGSVSTDKLDFYLELKPFFFDNISFDKARELIKAEEVDLDLLQESNHDIDANIDRDDLVLSTLDQESIIAELDDEIKYLVEKTKKKRKELSPCPLVDLIDEMHNDDINKGLRILGRWILYMAETTEEDKKKDLLTGLTS